MEFDFEKWEGLGNDFIVVFDDDPDLDAWRKLAPSLCDRHKGIGADGVLLTSVSDPYMHVINADGSEPEMCGNGVRCVGLAIAEQLGMKVGSLPIRTGAGELTVTTQSTGTGQGVADVVMGRVSFNFADAGVATGLAAPATDGPERLEAGLAGAGYVASIGNPHWIFIDQPKVDAAILGPQLETDARFTRRTNVEWVTRTGPGSVDVVVWERGVGFTQACGTGATAVGGLLVALGEAKIGEPVRVQLPGGVLEITVQDDGLAVMRGPARRVYYGEYG